MFVILSGESPDLSKNRCVILSSLDQPQHSFYKFDIKVDSTHRIHHCISSDMMKTKPSINLTYQNLHRPRRSDFTIRAEHAKWLHHKNSGNYNRNKRVGRAHLSTGRRLGHSCMTGISQRLGQYRSYASTNESARLGRDIDYSKLHYSSLLPCPSTSGSL